MPAATQLITSFLGGEISQYAQGRYDRPDYRTSMRVCLNSFPTESGAWTRRPGTQHASYTRGGSPGRVVKFDFEQSSPVTMEFTDGYVRFRNGAVLITDNGGGVLVTSISTANPAVALLSEAVLWSTGDTVVLPGAPSPFLEGRQIKVTKVDSTHFSLSDAITGATIDGSLIGNLGLSTTMVRVHELQTAYLAGAWQQLRVVQAEETAILLHPDVNPKAITATPPSSAAPNAVFAIGDLTFTDGPYLDPFTNGLLATPSAKSGVISITLSFNAWDSTRAYSKGDFVTASGTNYESLQDSNVGNTPASSPTFWKAANATDAIPDGFQGSDIGRLVRLYSEPAAWLAASSYSQGSIVSYNPSGQPGAATYWGSLTASNTGNVPGTDTTHWQLVPSGATLWTWGKIVSFTNLVDRTNGSAIGNMTDGGGNAAAFDGIFAQPGGSSAAKIFTGSSLPAGAQSVLTTYVGKNFGGSPQIINQAVVYPASDTGLGFGAYVTAGNSAAFVVSHIQLNLRGKNSAPASSSDGILLGFVEVTTNTSNAVTINSTDAVDSWQYVWIEMTVTFVNQEVASSYSIQNYIGQVSFFNPPGTGTGTGLNVAILGPALLTTNPIATWRLGVYSAATGWPTCGCYDGGRLYLGGAVPNRWDASVANGIDGTTIDFAPTDQFGNVAPDNAISYTFNSDSVNPIFWMSPELQGVIMGTQNGEWLVQAPTSGPISPTNVSARRVTKIGCANIEPRRTEHTTLFVKRYGRKLMEYFADVYSGKYSAPNLADKAQHVAAPGIAELAYTEATDPIAWGRDDAGGLFGVTYKRDSLSSAQGPTFYGWHRHSLGSGRTVESICSGPSADGNLDTLTMITSDGAIRHVEVLTNVPDETTPFAASWFLDDAVNPTSVVIGDTDTTLHGLWHLEGKTVQVFAGGLDLGDPGEGNPYSDFTVADGIITISYGDGIGAGPGRGLFTKAFIASLAASAGLSQIVVGFTYNSDGQIVRLVAQADTGARNGPALGAPSRSHRAALKFVGSKGVSIGGNFSRLYPCLFKTNGNSAKDLPVLSTFTGTFYDQVKDDFTYEDSLCWRISRPFPATIAAAAQNLRTEDM